jgi:hypothetical protein
VASCLHACYYGPDTDYSDLLHQYLSVARELRCLPGDDKLHDHQIVLTEVQDLDQSYVDVHLKRLDQDWSCSYVCWTQLIDLQVVDLVGLQTHEVLSHILWEITFHGLTNDKVNKSRETLENLCSSISGE